VKRFKHLNNEWIGGSSKTDKASIVVIFILFVSGFYPLIFYKHEIEKSKPVPEKFFSQKEIREILKENLPLHKNELKDGTEIHLKENLFADLTIDPTLQLKMEKIINQYNPDYASIVALDPKNGEIKAMIDYFGDPEPSWLNKSLSTIATFPAASIFKMITAAAALEQTDIGTDDSIPFNGRSTTLYRSNLSRKINRWTRFMTLETAFAKSVNPIFGKLGLYHIVKLDIPLEQSNAKVPDEGYGVAEAASGFNRVTTLSPVQGAMISAAIVNNGVMMAPYALKRVRDKNKVIYYEPKIRKVASPISQEAANELEKMMKKTVTRGTAMGSFRGYKRDPILKKLHLGGKTGSITGKNPHGRYDWYVGYAKSKKDPKKRLAFAVMIINKKYWKVRSARVARYLVRNYFKPLL
jgi:cell division protein FtsI/penicillin-binding protein 2